MIWPYSGGSTTVVTGRTSQFPPSGNEGYIHNRDVPFQSNWGYLPTRHCRWPFQHSV